MSHKSKRPQDNPSTETHQKPSEKESNNRHVYVDPGVQIDLVKDLRKIYEASQAEGTTHNKKQLFWTQVSAGLLFVYATLSLWQGYSAKRTADSALIDQRPYVVIKFPILTPKFVPSVPLLTAVDIVNIGRTPAFRMGDIIDLVYFPPPTRGPGDEYIMESQKRFIDTEFSNLTSGERQGRTFLTTMGAEDDLAPGADYFSSNRYPGLILTQAQIDDIRSTNPMGEALFLTGLITYADSANHPYRTEFCWYLTGEDATTWHRCRFHNIIR